jgi:hypothetical protein
LSEPNALVMVIRVNTSGTKSIFRRAPSITAGWHTLVRVWDG